MRGIFEIWRYRRAWTKMIALWEAECKRKGAITLQPGESIEVEILQMPQKPEIKPCDMDFCANCTSNDPDHGICTELKER